MGVEEICGCHHSAVRIMQVRKVHVDGGLILSCWDLEILALLSSLRSSVISDSIAEPASSFAFRQSRTFNFRPNTPFFRHHPPRGVPSNHPDWPNSRMQHHQEQPARTITGSRLSPCAPRVHHPDLFWEEDEGAERRRCKLWGMIAWARPCRGSRMSRQPEMRRRVCRVKNLEGLGSESETPRWWRIYGAGWLYPVLGVLLMNFRVHHPSSVILRDYWTSANPRGMYCTSTTTPQ